jgi:hypothetical protein
MKYAIYTAIYGNKDNLVDPPANSGDVDYICFTDSDLTSNTWNVIKTPGTHEDPVRSAKIYKILPHRYLKEYDVSIWIDGNVRIRNDVLPLVEKCYTESKFMIFEHIDRNCIYAEAEECKRVRLDQGSVINDQMMRYRETGYPSGNGLVIASVMVRRHMDPEIVKNMEDWWTEISNGSRRDQISFNYVAWKNDFKYNIIPTPFRDNTYFRTWGIHHNFIHKVK